MSRLPRVSGDQVIRAFQRLGFYEARQRGSHVVLKRQVGDSVAGCVVPRHKELATGTLHGILKQAQVSVDEFLSVL